MMFSWFKLFDKMSFSQSVASTGFTGFKSYLTLLAASFDGINNPDFRPLGDGTTFCNHFVNSVAKRMGCRDFDGKLANEMIAFMQKSPDWSEAPMAKAQWLASVGTLVIAAQEDKPHGHVCVIIPGVEQRSIHWSMPAPICANVGRDVFIGKGVNWAFREIPKFYLWRPSL